MTPQDVEKKMRALMVEAQKIAMEHNLCFVAMVDAPENPEADYCSLFCGNEQGVLALFQSCWDRIRSNISKINEPAAGGIQ